MLREDVISNCNICGTDMTSDFPFSVFRFPFSVSLLSANYLSAKLP